MTTPPNGLRIDPTIPVAPLPTQNAGPSSLLTSDVNGAMAMTATTTSVDDETQSSDELEVKDYGYGFGPSSGTGYAPIITREERVAREREWERNFEREAREREERERDAVTGVFGPVRPRRGSYAGATYPSFEAHRGGYEARGGGEFETRGGFEQRGGSYEPRGNYEPRAYARRGRAFGRGYNSRGYGRGGYQQRQQQQQPPPFTATPPDTQFQPLPQHNEPVNGYYQPPQPLANYIPSAYEPFQPPAAIPSVPAPAPLPQGLPPVPVPLSNLSFPLDPTRYYLLGQLEYYLSPQNLAQDFFLRQRVSNGLVMCLFLSTHLLITRLRTDGFMRVDTNTIDCIIQSREIVDHGCSAGEGRSYSVQHSGGEE
jgi:la-related protein 1